VQTAAVQAAAEAEKEKEKEKHTRMGGTSSDTQGRRDLKAFCAASERRRP
jgi:hypothetical protein